MKYLVVLDDGSPLNATKPQVKTFEENQENEMEYFIEEKAHIGFTCHVFNYMNSAKAHKTIFRFTQ